MTIEFPIVEIFFILEIACYYLLQCRKRSMTHYRLDLFFFSFTADVHLEKWNNLAT